MSVKVGTTEEKTWEVEPHKEQVDSEKGEVLAMRVESGYG
jgi:hypothetical protein